MGREKYVWFASHGVYRENIVREEHRLICKTLVFIADIDTTPFTWTRPEDCFTS